MIFTSEDLMKAMGLSVGDKVKIGKLAYIIDFDCVLRGIGHNEAFDCYGIHMLVGTEYEILSRPKRVGELKCKDFECAKCHLRCLPHCNQLDNGKKTLFNILDGWNEYDTFDQEIYDLLKARLDKVVE